MDMGVHEVSVASCRCLMSVMSVLMEGASDTDIDTVALWHYGSTYVWLLSACSIRDIRFCVALTAPNLDADMVRS